MLADDATGALECASILAGLRYAVTVSIGVPEFLPSWEGVLVVDLESRNLSGAEARFRLGACVERVRAHGIRRFYLKTDSTLRGHIGGSLVELLDRLRGGSVVYVPAYPKLRRTVRGGRLFVDGVPLEETAFAADVRHPVRSSLILSLFTGDQLERVSLVSGAAQLVSQIDSGGRRILICDGEQEEDLLQIAEVLRESGEGFVVAGPSGFVSYWAGLGRFVRRVEEKTRKLGRWLVVCGSLHPQSRTQLAFASALGVATLQSDSCKVISPELAASELARRVVEEVRQRKPEAILIMGGDTAFVVWKALGVSVLVPLPEVVPGVAACWSPERELVFVTKAGGFGDDSLVQQVMEKMQ